MVYLVDRISNIMYMKILKHHWKSVRQHLASHREEIFYTSWSMRINWIYLFVAFVGFWHTSGHIYSCTVLFIWCITLAQNCVAAISFGNAEIIDRERSGKIMWISCQQGEVNRFFRIKLDSWQFNHHHLLKAEWKSVYYRNVKHGYDCELTTQIVKTLRFFTCLTST